MQSLTITSVALEQIYPLRSKVLRPNQPIESCYYPEDKLSGVFHLAAIADDAILAIGSFYPEAHQAITAEKPYRLRGMAVEPDYQGLGLGQKLLQASFAICQRAGSDLLWCNARSSAEKFYKKQGFRIVGEAFEIPDIGAHFLMVKRFEP